MRTRRHRSHGRNGRPEGEGAQWRRSLRAALTALVAAPVAAGCDGGAGSGIGGTGGTGTGGAGQITGTFDGAVFDAVKASYVIGASDDPAHTTTIYVFDHPIACAEIAGPGWDAKIADQTQAIEIKLIGKQTGKYPVAVGPNPASGEASVSYTLSSTSKTPAETVAKNGSVTLAALVDKGAAEGSFDLQFPNGAATGSFDATYCKDGSEP